MRMVVVDNSEDGGRSAAAMAGGLGALRRDGVTVDLLSPARNLGFAGGVDFGLVYIKNREMSQVLLINSDATLEAGALAKLLACAGPSTCVVPYSRRTEGGRGIASPLVFYQRAFALYLRHRSRGVLTYPSGTCLLLAPDVAGGALFDKDFFFYGEDVMLGAGFARRGVRVVACEGAVVCHAGSASARNGSMFYEYHMNRAHWLLGRKLAGSEVQRVMFTAARCISLPLRALVRSVRFWSLVPWHGLAAATSDVIRGRCRSFTPPPSE